MMGSAEGQSRYYEAALWALRFVEARRATRRRFEPRGGRHLGQSTWIALSWIYDHRLSRTTAA
jgi:hypothetical protein